MRSHPSEYEIVAPGSLHAVVSLLANGADTWLPIAGGTDVMVQYAVGKLPVRKLVSIWNLPELRRIEITAGEILIGERLAAILLTRRQPRIPCPRCSFTKRS
jgi:CO/xanthine dehydrogenase FAD-binding subunit